LSVSFKGFSLSRRLGFLFASLVVLVVPVVPVVPRVLWVPVVLFLGTDPSRPRPLPSLPSPVMWCEVDEVLDWFTPEPAVLWVPVVLLSRV
jgi:hypothetical protein